MTKLALLIGVSDYAAGLPSLPGTQTDIQTMERVLRQPTICGFDQVQVLPNPNPTEMQLAIEELFADRQKNDLVLLYFSGHGVVKEQILYLGIRMTQLRPSGEVSIPTVVSASNIQGFMSRSRSRRQVLILDCCYSGAFAEGMTAKSLDTAINLEAQLGGEGRAVLTSSTATQQSYEEQGAAIYTRYLLEGIETGAADTDNNGVITVDELHQYAKRKTQEAAPAMKPEIYAVQEGYRIQLAQAPVGDPRLKYRKEVEKRVYEGRFTIPARRILDSLRSQLPLTPEEAEAIEAEVLQPYRDFQNNVQDYEETLKETVNAEGYPFSDITLRDLQAYQQHLGLRDEDIAPIAQKILDPLQSAPPPPATESSNTELDRSASPTAGERSPTPNHPHLRSFEFEVVLVDKKGAIAQRQRHQANYFREDLGNGVTLDMVAIPGGSFLMGSPEDEPERLDSESPQHRVTVQPFFMGKFPVTQAQWRAIASLPKIKIDLKPEPSHFKGKERPVEQISWWDAVEFCQRLSRKTGNAYRLPSEAEWEYACRAGTKTPFHFGEMITTALANYCGEDRTIGKTLYEGSYGSGPKGL